MRLHWNRKDRAVRDIQKTAAHVRRYNNILAIVGVPEPKGYIERRTEPVVLRLVETGNLNFDQLDQLRRTLRQRGQEKEKPK